MNAAVDLEVHLIQVPLQAEEICAASCWRSLTDLEAPLADGFIALGPLALFLARDSS